MKSYCGSDNVDYWDDDEWRAEIESHQVMVMVHDVFLILLNRKSDFNFDNVNLLIIDEVHHTNKNHPYM